MELCQKLKWNSYLVALRSFGSRLFGNRAKTKALSSHLMKLKKIEHVIPAQCFKSTATSCQNPSFIQTP